MALFQKLGMFTDIHFDEHGGSEEHNQTCLNFVDWFIDQTEDCDVLCFGGDWHHHRPKVNTQTLGPSFEAIKKLAGTGKPVFWIIGNHDLMYLDKRQPHSLPFLYHFENIVTVDEPMNIEGCAFIPWIVESDDQNRLIEPGTKYVFGHFEFPGFLMNQNYEMPDKEGLFKAEMISGPDYVFSGHYHGRQKKTMKSGTNIHYIGNAFPHNFSDANDFDRGLMKIEWGKEPEYINWPDMPVYRSLKASEFGETGLLNEVKPNDIIRIDDDIGLSTDEKDELRETIGETFNVEDVRFRPIRKRQTDTEAPEIDLSGDDVYSVIVEGLKQDDNPDYDGDLLAEIFLSAEIEEAS